MRYLLVLLLAGCAQKVWHQEGASTRDFEMDKGLCQAQAFGATGMYTQQVALIFNSCMRGRGWQLQDRQ